MNIEFENILSQLSDEEKKEVNQNNIDLPEKFIPLLLRRVHPQNVQELAALIKQSVLPSICPKTDDEIDQLFSRVDKDPNLLFIKSSILFCTFLSNKRLGSFSTLENN
jgi:hypothetical protein